MVAPEVQYFLDCSAEAHNLALDTHFHFMVQREDTDEFFDRYDNSRPVAVDRHWHRLQDMALYMDDEYVRWRDEAQGEILAASYAMFNGARNNLVSLIDDASAMLVDLGHGRIDPEAIQSMDDRFGFNAQIAMFERGMRRAREDFSGFRSNLIDLGRREHEQAWRSHHERHIALLERVRESVVSKKPRTSGDKRSVDRSSRRILKRATKLFERFLGPQQTRLFIGGQAIILEGKNCLYQVSRGRSLSDSHGVELRLLTKDGEDLCNVCIYTPGVPMADHVVSLLLHIQSGEEDDILRIGNMFMIHDAAYREDWLIPYLPERRLIGQQDNREPIAFRLGQTVEDRERRQEAKMNLLPVVAGYVISRLFPCLPNELRDVRVIEHI